MELSLEVEEFFDDLLWYDYIYEKDELIKRLYIMLKKGEFDPLVEVCPALQKLSENYQYNYEFMQCPELPIVRQKSLEAFKVFLEKIF